MVPKTCSHLSQPIKHFCIHMWTVFFLYLPISRVRSSCSLYDRCPVYMCTVLMMGQLCCGVQGVVSHSSKDSHSSEGHGLAARWWTFPTPGHQYKRDRRLLFSVAVLSWPDDDLRTCSWSIMTRMSWLKNRFFFSFKTQNNDECTQFGNELQACRIIIIILIIIIF